MKNDTFLDLLVTEADPERLWQAAAFWLADKGFDRVIHLRVDGPGQVTARSTLGVDFEGFYHDEQLSRHDPFLTYCLPATRPVPTGVDYLDRYAYLRPEERRVIELAGEAGFRAGFSAVTRREGKGCEAWNIGSSLRRREVEALRAEDETELKLGLVALRGRLDGALAIPLSGRERQCLELLSEGMRTKAIARDLGLAAVTVELHLRNARAKLGAQTRDQALMLYRRHIEGAAGKAGHPAGEVDDGPCHGASIGSGMTKA